MKLQIIILLVSAFTLTQGQDKKNIHFTCSFLDDSTGNYLKSQIFSVRNNEKIGIGKTNTNFIIDLDLSVEDALLELEYSNNYSISLPINYYGKFEKKSYANFIFSVSKSKNELFEKDLLIYCFPEDFQKSNEYQVSHFVNNSLHCTNNISKFLTNKNALIIPLSKEVSPYSSYQVSIVTVNSIIRLPKFSVEKGVNFIDLNVYTLENISLEQSSQDSIDNKNDFAKTWINRTIYFNQSEYELKNEYFSTLDSVINYFKRNPNSIIYIMGFTDNVGDKNLNTTLAEYRAKVVANYLVNKGINKKRVSIEWQKSNIESINIVENSKFRKVVISKNKL